MINLIFVSFFYIADQIYIHVSKKKQNFSNSHEGQVC